MGGMLSLFNKESKIVLLSKLLPHLFPPFFPAQDHLPQPGGLVLKFFPLPDVGKSIDFVQKS